MFVLDTNVVSELMKAQPNVQVRNWLNAQDLENLYLCSVSWFELLYCMESLPAGRKKNSLKQVLLSLQDDLFASRILPFDEESASLLSKLLADAQRKGRSASIEDAQIASVAFAQGYTVVSRDVKPYKALGVKVLNPWLT